MITDRQEKLLNFLIKEYITTAEPVSSKALKKSADLNCCEATIRNDLQALAEAGYIKQPHTSAGRIPTKKSYKYFADKMTTQIERPFETDQGKNLADFIVRQIEQAHKQIEQEMKVTEELMKSLSATSVTISVTGLSEKDNLFEILNFLGSAKPSFNENINIINKIIKDLEQW